MTAEQEQRIIDTLKRYFSEKGYSSKAEIHAIGNLHSFKKSGALDEVKEIWKSELIERLPKECIFPNNLNISAYHEGSKDSIYKAIQIIKEL